MSLIAIVILTEVLFWWRIKSDFRHESAIVYRLIVTIKLFFSVVLILSVLSLLLIQGEIAVPKNAFAHIFYGAIAYMTIGAGFFFIFFSILRSILFKWLKKDFKTLKWIYTIVTALIIVLFVNGYFYGRFNYRVEKRDIYFAYPDKRIDGLKIALISDLHLSSFEGHYGKLKKITEIINSNNPDISVNTGDFVTYGWQEFSRCDTILKKIHAPYGSFAVSGNHDDCSYNYQKDKTKQIRGTAIIDSLIISSGYTLLNDTSATILYKGAKVSIAGITTRGHHFKIRYGDKNKALTGITDKSFLIFLVHDPDFWARDPEISNEAELTLSGHTHGMQVGIPRFNNPSTPFACVHKYCKGLYYSGGHALYVNCGIGTMSMAERIFMPPEITILTIHCK